MRDLHVESAWPAVTIYEERAFVIDTKTKLDIYMNTASCTRREQVMLSTCLPRFRLVVFAQQYRSSTDRLCAYVQAPMFQLSETIFRFSPHYFACLMSAINNICALFMGLHPTNLSPKPGNKVHKNLMMFKDSHYIV